MATIDVGARRRGPDQKRPPTVQDTRGIAMPSQDIAPFGARPKRPKLTEQLQDGNGETAKAPATIPQHKASTTSKKSHHSSPFFTPINTLRRPMCKSLAEDRPPRSATSSSSARRRRRREDDSRSPSPSLSLAQIPSHKFNTAPKLKYAPKPVARNRSVMISKVRTRSQAEKESGLDEHPRTLTHRSNSMNNIPAIPKWSSSLIYPPTGRKRAEVEFRDLERLNDDEFLNDNIIGLYIRFLEHHVERRSPELAKRIYFFNSYFFASLTNTPRGSRDTINYQSVQKWTRNVDIFSYDYVVVPIHDKAHWFLAIVCNLPALLQPPSQEQEGEKDDDCGKQESQGSYAQSEAVATETTISDEERDGDGQRTNASNSVVEIPNDLVKDDGEEARTDTPQKKETRSETDIIASSDDELAVQKMTPLKKKRIPIETESPRPEQQLGGNSIDVDEIPTVTGEETTRSRTSEKSSQQPGESQTPANKPQGQEKQTYSKRRKRPRPTPQKFDVKQPIIITLDSLGCARSPISRALRDYLWDECSTKRHVDLNTREIKGITAKQIPLQQNFSDCGLYLLAYLERFVQDPDEFVTKLLRREMNVDTDWPELDSRELRRQLRSFLVNLHDEQDRREEQQKNDKDAAASRRPPLVDVTPLHILLRRQSAKAEAETDSGHGSINRRTA